MKLGHRRMHKFGKVLVPELHRLLVRSRLEHDLLVCRERPIDIHFQPVEIAERRHRPHLAIGEKPLELILGRQSDRGCSEDLFESCEIHFPVGRDHHHRKPLTHLHHHHLGHFFSRHMEHLGDLRGGEGLPVGQDFILDFLVIEVILEPS